MTVEDIERRARRHLDDLLAIYGRLPPTQGSGDMLAHDLAKFVLAVLPVVRAAEGLREVHDADELVSNTEPKPCDCALCSAIDTLRAAMEGK